MNIGVREMSEESKNILPWVFEYTENQDTKIANRVRKWLDKDYMRGIILYKNVFWFELGRNDIPNYVYDYLKSHLKKQGYEYLYDRIK